MRVLVSAWVLFVAAAVSAPAQANVTQKPFENTACGFRVKLPAGWKVKPSSSQKCVFTVLVADQAKSKLRLAVRKDTVEHGEADLGFAHASVKWVLKGDETVDAEAIDSSTWIGLQGTVPIHNKGSNQGTGHETRALLFDKKDRIAEFVGDADEGVIESFVDGFEFLAEAS